MVCFNDDRCFISFFGIENFIAKKDTYENHQMKRAWQTDRSLKSLGKLQENFGLLEACSLFIVLCILQSQFNVLRYEKRAWKYAPKNSMIDRPPCSRYLQKNAKMLTNLLILYYLGNCCWLLFSKSYFRGRITIIHRNESRKRLRRGLGRRRGKRFRSIKQFNQCEGIKEFKKLRKEKRQHIFEKRKKKKYQ